MNAKSMLMRKAIADITQRKGRTVLVTLGILIGVLGLTAVNIANDMIGGAFIYSHDQSTSPDMIFSTAGVDPAAIQIVRQIPNIDRLQMRNEYHSHWHIASGSGSVSIQINGYADLQHVQLGTFQLTSGHLPGLGEILMDSRDNTVQPVMPGEMVLVDMPTGRSSLRVSGLVRTLGWATQYGSAQATAYMQAASLQKIASTPFVSHGKSKPGLAVVMMIKVRDVHRAQQTFQAVSHALEQAHVKASDASLYDTSSGDAIINGMLSIIRVLSLVALLLTCLLMVNTISVMITEQMKIIGTMKAIGGTRWRIILSYLISVGVYSIIGTTLGIAAGIFLGEQLASFLAGLSHIDLGPLSPALWVIAVSVMVGLCVPILAALGPLWMGIRITVREAMAAYGVSAGKASAWGKRLTWLPQTTLLGIRGTFRKPIRAVLTILALTLSCAMFMAVQITTSSVGSTLDQQANAFRSDLTAHWGSINYRPGIYQAMRQSVQSLPNVERVEPETSETVTTAQGDISLTGLDAQTQLYQYHLVAGRWLASQEADTVVVSDLAAQKLNLRVGSQLALAEDKERVNWKVVGIIHDLDVSGGIGTAFTTLENMNVHLSHLPADSMMMLMVRAHDHSNDAVGQLAGQVNSALSNLNVQAEVMTHQEMVAQVQSVNMIIYILFYAVASIVAFVGLLGLFNTLSTSVLERRLEIGLLRSLGARSKNVASVFWLEGLVLASIAYLIGTIVGIPIAYGLVRLLSTLLEPFDFYFPVGLLLTTLCFVLVITFIASVGPALQASRMRLRDVLRYE